MLPERALEARNWLRLAHQDLLLAERALYQAPPLLESGGFHCQQAAEKSLKAFLVWQEQVFPRTHELPLLIGLCSQEDPTFSALLPIAEVLTPFAVEFRYPTDEPPPTTAEGERALDFARRVLDFVSQRLPEEVGR